MRAPTALLSLLLGLNTISYRKYTATSSKQSSSFWWEDWKRETLVNWKVQEKSQAGRIEKLPLELFMQSWVHPMNIHGLTLNSIHRAEN